MLGYNFLVRRNKSAIERIRNFASDVHSVLLSGSRVSARVDGDYEQGRLIMAMNIGSDGDDDEVVSAINTTPLVDVMLVLLIIFLITIPVVTHTDPGNAAARNATRRCRPSRRTSSSR